MALAIASIVITLMLGGISLWLALKSIRQIKRKRPVWAYISTKIIGLEEPSPKELEIRFAGKPVTDVHDTVFIFFNSGNDVIRPEDVAVKPTIFFEGAEILEGPHILAASRKEIHFSAEPISLVAGDGVELGFSFLDNQDGAVVGVVHTGAEEIKCLGTIIGAEGFNVGSESLFLPFLPKDSPLDKKGRSIRRLSLLAGAIAIGNLAMAFVHFELVLSSILAFAMCLFLVFLIWANIYIHREFARFRKFPEWTASLVNWP